MKNRFETIKINDIISNYWLISGLIIIFIYYIPYLILGENCFITIHDNLDGVFVNKVILARTGWVSDKNQTIYNIMNGLPVTSLGSKISFSFILYSLFKPLAAYLINNFLVKVIAFIGMYLLLMKHIFRGNNKIVPFLLSLIFCFIPFYTALDLSTAGQPLLYYSFYNLYKSKRRKFDYILIIFYAFYSSLVVAGVFIGFLLFCILIVDSLKEKRINKTFLLGFICLCGGYIIAEYQLFIISFMSDGFVSHRVDWKIEPFTFIEQLKKTVDILQYNQIHVGHLNTIIILISTFLTIAFSIYVKNEDTKSNELKKDYFLFIRFLFIIIAGVLIFYFFWPYIVQYLGDTFEIVKTFQFDRFYILLPTIWILLFALNMKELLRFNKTKIIVVLIMLQMVLMIISNVTYLKNIAYLTKFGLQEISVKMTYKKFFDENLFSTIDDYIAKDKKDYRVVSLGIHPSVSIYNGFYALDSYQNFYKKEYKDKFRKIIIQELDKNESQKKYFDYWGSRCYIFSSEINSYIIGKSANIEIDNFEIDLEALKKMGGEYIFSTVKICNADKIDLKFERYFESEESYWGIYLYRLDEE